MLTKIVVGNLKGRDHLRKRNDSIKMDLKYGVSI